MAAIPSEADNLNFIRGLSDFWPRFFEDTASIEAFFDAAQTQIGQLYLELMEATLGTSLEYMPVFDKRYWHLLTVREDRVRFSEGPSPDEDRFVFTPNEALVGARYLVNRITDPTVVFEAGVDFDLRDGEVALRNFNLNTDYGFATRYLTLAADAVLDHPRRAAWSDVRQGDTLAVQLQSGTAVEVPITLVQGNKLILASAPETIKVNLLDRPATRQVTYSVYRTPFDHVRRGVSPRGRITSIRRFGLFKISALGTGVVGLTDAIMDVVVTAVLSPNIIRVSNPDPSWTGKCIAVRDAADAVNTGIYTIAEVTATTVRVLAGLTNVSSGPFTAFVGNPPGAQDVGSHVFLNDTEHAINDVGYVRVAGFNTDTPFSFFFGALNLVDTSTMMPTYQVKFSGTTGDTAVTELPDSHIAVDSVEVLGTRRYACVVSGALFPAGGALVSGVDYRVDHATGVVHHTSVWEPSSAIRVNYEYRLLVHREVVRFRGTYAAMTAYSPNDVVRSSGKSWVSLAAPTGVTPGTDPAAWMEYTAPFAFDVPTQIRELAMWVPDALIDKDRLYTQHGYLLSFKKPSSEGYRAFLRGVSQLFLLGPSLGRMESAFNVMAGLPVVREDGEVFQVFESAYEPLNYSGNELATGGEIMESAYGNTGRLDVVTGLFTVLDASYTGAWSHLLSYAAGEIVTQMGLRYRANVATTLGAFLEAEWTTLPPLFYPDDVGGALTLQRADGDVFYVTLSTIEADGYGATVLPAPSATETELLWQFVHTAIRRRFTVKGSGVTRPFTQEDVGAYVIIEASREARNRGTFQIEAVEGPRVVYLNAGHAFVDEGGLTFRVSRSLTHKVHTDKRRYLLPVGAPPREDLLDSTNERVLTFKAFEALTEAVVIEDYVRNDSWWHTTSIPQEILEEQPDVRGRRQVSPQLVEHIVGALDQAASGDLGLVAGRDGEGEPGIERPCTATWLGEGWVKISLAAGVNLRVRDVGQYLTVEDVGFAGSYEILQVQEDLETVLLARFPPREARGLIAPVVLTRTELPPILYRRTVAFVLMDRLLKYHALRIRINAPDLFTAEFVHDALSLLREAKPAGSFVYLEPVTDFNEVLHLRENFELTYGPWIEELFSYEPFPLRSGTEMRVGEFFAYFDQNYAVVLPGGAYTYTVTPVLPYVADRTKLMFARFRSGTSDGRPLTEGVNYTVNYATGVITIPNSDAGAAILDVIILALRVPSPWLEPWWDNANSGTVGDLMYGETPVHTGGTDPAIRERAGIIQPSGQSIVEPPLQLIVS